MHSRIDALKRLMSLYGSVEAMHSAELQRTMASVQEAESAIHVQEKTIDSSTILGCDALISGDRMKWAAAKTQREIAECKQQRLQQVRLEREKLNEEARKEYRASRLRSEQIQHVIDDAATQIEIKTGRQTQATLDDRFLARRRWTDALYESRLGTK